MVAQEMGYFKQEGLDVTLVPMSGAKEALIQVAAGNGEVANISPTNLMVGQQPPNNMQVQLFYDVYYKCIWSISVLPDSPIKSVAQLKGKKIGVSSMGSSGVTFGQAFLAKAGLKIPQDAQYLPIGVGGRGATALRTGAVAAVVYWDAMVTKLAEAGVKLRALPVDPIILRLPDISLGARTDYMAKNPKVIAGVGRALAKGYVFNQANPEAAVRITWKKFPESKPANVPEAKALSSAIAVNQSRMKIWSSDETGGQFGKFVPKDFEAVEKFAKEFGLLDPKAKVDMKRIYTQKFVPEFNKFDQAKIVAEAKAWK
jgi:NitT/TauT family transport system substrate-binding protein